MARNSRLVGQGTSPLFQFWTTVRLRVFLRAAAVKAAVSQSEFVRLAIWHRIESTLTEAERKRAERQAEAEAAQQGKERTT